MLVQDHSEIPRVSVEVRFPGSPLTLFVLVGGTGIVRQWFRELPVTLQLVDLLAPLLEPPQKIYRHRPYRCGLLCLCNACHRGLSCDLT